MEINYWRVGVFLPFIVDMANQKETGKMKRNGKSGYPIRKPEDDLDHNKPGTGI
ncbi:hypothetical protein MTO98_26220 [Mucilaginibacter sp. SMC90]|uniref:hypothetical protein n=1 Tax=Mucilaginibacter sp. SMC90 TaxID=2929803 RepID=UPI001FB342CC|nr:hypothetical protein [Mucilaginibacter sp. SMC90]UOE47911.1 hypothetical protein MTO98_26220 [Mucilaginibacter sp. SMC90]